MNVLNCLNIFPLVGALNFITFYCAAIHITKYTNPHKKLVINKQKTVLVESRRTMQQLTIKMKGNWSNNYCKENYYSDV